MARTVLLADDSVTAQNMGRRILTDAGYEVITVNNGSAALKKIHESRPDLVVLDVYMPGYGGLEVCQRIKESEATMKIPVLLTVGKMEPFKTDEAKRVRADGHIIKPFDASELLAALTRMEDRIVPQSGNGRGRQAKAEPKKPVRRFKADPLAEEEDLRNDRISYLEETKKRQAASSTEKSRDGEEAVREKASSDPRTAPTDEVAEEAVTFASGPIYRSEPGKSETWSAPAKAAAAPEFPIERPAVFEQPVESIAQAAVSSTADEQDVNSEAAHVESQSQPAGGVDSVAAPEPSPEVTAVSAEAEKVVEPPKSEATPHWIAENIAVSAEEASRSLDQEMRDAHAESHEVSEQQVQEPTPVTEASPEAAPEVGSLPAASEEQAEPANPETDSSGAAFAAAASTSGSSLVDAVSTDAVAATPQPDRSEPERSEPEPEPGAEATAAWENWQRIRDSVVNQHLAGALAESVAGIEESPKSSTDEADSGPQASEAAPVADSAAPQSLADAPSQAAGNDALSSIVDNVLAELKPRLLAEIAKQLASDKK